MKTLITASLLGLFSTAPLHAATLQTASVLDLLTLEAVSEAETTLTRIEDGVELNIETQDLEPGVYTVWFDAINRPENCQGECDLDDVIFNAEAIELSEFFVAGTIVGDDGKGSFSGQVFEGVLPTGNDQITRDFSGGQGLLDAQKSEVFFFIRWHGPVNPELLEEQITTFNGGCGAGLFEGCTEVQIGQFPAASVPEPATTFGILILGALGIGSLGNKFRH
ncbi:MAG: PEP-CTERM sorting domain-containing protein [Cyanobacteria bacterium J06592_8]